jgi:hypothetical protein
MLYSKQIGRTIHGRARIEGQRTKRRSHGFKIIQEGTVSFGSRVCKGPNGQENAGYAMPLHELPRTVPVDYLSPAQRRVYEVEMGKALKGIAPDKRKQYRGMFHQQCVEMAQQVKAKRN